MLLNRRLKRLKADEHSLKATIAELITATEIAERAIGGLKHTVRDVNENLGGQLAAAAQLTEHLKRQLAEGDHVVRRLTKIAIAARPSQAEPEIREPAPREPAARDFASRDAAAKPSNAKALAAAAQAFSERRRSGGLAA
jgi:chromosome segregation ATPase